MFNNGLGDCSSAQKSTPSDAGVAGAGILLAFVITAALALLLSTFIVLSEVRGKSSRNISRKILNGLSDQQIVEGIGIQVVGLARVNSMVPYHFFIIWCLALLSTATNFATLLALVQDFKRDWVLRWVRQFAIFINLVLSIVFGIFVLEANMESLSPTLPIACVWQDHDKSPDGQSNTAVSVAGTMAVIAADCIIFLLSTWYLHMRGQKWGKFVRVISLVALTAIAIGAAARVILISQAFGSPSVNLSDTGERDWSFGQLLTMLLLILPFLSALEIVRGEVQVPKAKPHADSDQQPLTASDEEFQPVFDGRYKLTPFSSRM